MTRRAFLVGAGAVAAWPNFLSAQQKSRPVVGFLRNSSAADSAGIVEAFRKGLREAGYIEGQDVTIDYRWADGRAEALPAMAAELASSKVAVILASASEAIYAARAATPTIPIVFVTGADPVAVGFVASLNRPGGNATGIAYVSSGIGAKRLDILRQLVPSLKSVGVLVHAQTAPLGTFLPDIEAGARTLGLRLVVAKVNTRQEIDGAFAAFVAQQTHAVVVAANPMFTGSRARIVELAARHALPTIYTTREFAQAGGLIAWGVNLADQYRLAGVYVGKILSGASPGDLPVQRPTRFDTVINLKTANALGLSIPRFLLVGADLVPE